MLGLGGFGAAKELERLLPEIPILFVFVLDA
jgi:hypothetical protein